MPYDARTFRVLIASPSDVIEEREIAVRTIQEWNDLHSNVKRLVLLPLRWETHTAPDYGTRPQEVINQAIVDECDLLVGIFWTRIGTPTGESASGTLEEIDRAAKAGKPVMLYFSKQGADPSELDLEQVTLLNAFRENTYASALVESYRSTIEFRDKFAKQLEMKVRDLQSADSADRPPPISVEFVSLDTGELIGTQLSRSVSRPRLNDIDTVVGSEPNDSVKQAINANIRERVLRSVSVPAVFGVSNADISGIRNLYVELDAQVTTGEADALLLGQEANDWSFSYLNSKPDLLKQVEAKLAKFAGEGLTRTESGWTFSFEWEAIQPKRMRIVKPILFFVPHTDCEINVTSTIFADSFPDPVIISNRLTIEITDVEMTTRDLLPDFEKIVKKAKNSMLDLASISRTLMPGASESADWTHGGED